MAALPRSGKLFDFFNFANIAVRNRKLDFNTAHARLACIGAFLCMVRSLGYTYHRDCMPNSASTILGNCMDTYVKDVMPFFSI